MKILFVCLGNICRSPIAEGVLRHICSERKLLWQIDSAGLESFHVGEMPHRFSREVCSENAIDISSQKARQFSVSDLDRFDRIYAMSMDVYRQIMQMAGKRSAAHVRLFLDEMPGPPGRSVKDPWYGDKDGYYDVYHEIYECCTRIADTYSSIKKVSHG